MTYYLVTAYSPYANEFEIINGFYDRAEALEEIDLTGPEFTQVRLHPLESDDQEAINTVMAGLNPHRRYDLRTVGERLEDELCGI